MSERLYNSVNQSQFFGSISFDISTGKGHVHGFGQGNQLWQALSATTSRQQTKHHFRQGHGGLLVLDSNAIVASQDNLRILSNKLISSTRKVISKIYLESTSETRAHDGCDNRLLAVLHPGKDSLAILADVGAIFDGLALAEHLDVCSSNEASWFSGDEHGCLHTWVILDLLKEAINFYHHFIVQ